MNDRPQNAHLSDEQLTHLLLGEVPAEAAEHLYACAECRHERDTLECALAGFGQGMRAAAERPAGFWYRQRAAIAERLSAQPTRPARMVAWAGTFAALVLAALFAMPREVEPPVGQTDPDHQLMVDVQRSARREVPRALEPALLLTQELNAAALQATSRQ